jgi:hypothetical protein
MVTSASPEEAEKLRIPSTKFQISTDAQNSNVINRKIWNLDV